MWEYKQFFRFEHSNTGLALRDFLNEQKVSEFTMTDNNHNYLEIVYKLK